MERVEKAGLQIDGRLATFLEQEALPGTGVSADAFWNGLSHLVHGMGPENRALLQKREDMQARIDAWHVKCKDRPDDMGAYKAFLQRIGYLLPEGPDFRIETANVDPEIADVAGPQLVVPITNARYAL
ncbi:MAG: malate synthase G, partial [Pseudomonadota bacterium]